MWEMLVILTPSGHSVKFWVFKNNQPVYLFLESLIGSRGKKSFVSSSQHVL